jgi:alkylation response protein AidB-like acyl-CoA dehydrogenase
VAGAQTTALRDGDEWVMNGSKIWTSGAWWADWGLCLARTNWDVPKHRGLTVFMLPIHQPGIEIHRIEMLNGSREFCQEFITDVRIPDSERLGSVDQGWTVGTRWMYHERTVSGGSPYVTRPAGHQVGRAGAAATAVLVDRLGSSAHIDEGRQRELIGEMRALELVSPALTQRISDGIRAGRMSDQSAAITRLFGGTAATRMASLAFELAGSKAVAWGEDEDQLGESGIFYLMRQAACIGGGTTEMSRNVISERVLGMPRERSGDKDIPFREVPRSATSR